MKPIASELLNLIDEKGQHHQVGKYGGQMLLTVTIIVLQMIPLIF